MWRIVFQLLRSRSFFPILIVSVLVAAAMVEASERVEAAVPVASLDVGTDISCAVTAWGAGYCWGNNTYGGVGDGTTTARPTPVVVSGGFQWRSLSAGGNHACGVTVAGVGYCWGANWNYQLGNGTPTQSNVPTPVSGGVVWRTITTNWDTTCGISISDDLYCWGKNDFGQVGSGTTFNAGTPWIISGGWKTVETGESTTCGIKLDLSAWCWGKNNSSQVGDGTTTDRTSPTVVSGGYSSTAISVGKTHVCALRDDQRMYCWGADANGALANGAAADQSTPGLISGSDHWTSLGIGEYHTCGITVDGDAKCAGYNDYGQIGDSSTTHRDVMTMVSGAYKWRSIASGIAVTTCAMRDDGYAMCWGGGGIGDGTTGVMRTVPTAVHIDVTATTTIQVSVEPEFTFTVGVHTGPCNGVAQTGSSSATVVDLGHVNAANGVAAQDLTIATNAASGFTVYGRSSGPMTSNGHALAAVGGSNAGPISFPSYGTEAFGYTTSDASLGTGTVDRFTSGGAKWAALTMADAELSSGSGPATPDAICVAYQAGRSVSTPAGTYSTTVVYTAVPAF